MGLTPEDYQAQAQALTPTGKAWATGDDSLFNKLLLAISDEFSRVDNRAAALLEEVDPRFTTELVEDWERVLGLPDNCSGELADTIVGRRNAIVTKLNSTGGQTPQYLIDRAADLGFDITITEFSEFTVESEVSAPLYGEDWVYYFQVNAPLNSLTYFDTLSVVTDPLADWGNDILECLINRLKPAHTGVIFAYT